MFGNKSGDTEDGMTRSVEKRLKELESQMRQALCEHHQEYVYYTPYGNNRSANPEYEKTCGLCDKPMGLVLESEMHRDIATDAQRKADKHTAAANYIESKQ